MINELYSSLVQRISEHGVIVKKDTYSTNHIYTPIDKDHAVITFSYTPSRCFVFLGNKSFLIRMWNEDDKTRNNS
jgi:hypothetical protein